MNAIATVGMILVAVGIVIFLLEGLCDLRGYGQMVACLRLTLLVIGFGVLIWGATQKQQAESGPRD